MKKSFGNLVIGLTFYPVGKSGIPDIKMQLIKTSRIRFVNSGPWDGIKATENVLRNQHFNAVIITSPTGELNGYYDYLDDKLIVYMENPKC
jgi:hypothetical protein